MTKTDYMYLGLILLTALAFYCNGFYAGVQRARRTYDELFEAIDESDGEEVRSPRSSSQDQEVLGLNKRQEAPPWSNN